MSAWLDGLRRALDAAPRPVAFFFRDDDAGWDDDGLFALLDLFARHSAPIDLAAIPSALTRGLAASLRARMEGGPGLLAVHQHGFAHLNHEPEGRRKCEFGEARGWALQQSDIESGRRVLCDLFGRPVSPVFTPPWNRCTAVTGECLLRAGFRVLSRDSTAGRLGLEGLFELPVTVDWFAKRKGVRLSPDELGASLAAAAGTAAPVGVMFHHAPMDEDERRRAGELLALLTSHRNSRCSLMERLAPGASPGGAARAPGRSQGQVTGRRPFVAHTTPTTVERK
jgi:hypothetical protein